MITFFAPGLPRSQGSKRHVGHGVMIEQTEVKAWRGVVAVAASNAMREAGAPLIDAACKAVLVFRFPRPAGHFKVDGTLKPSAPWWPGKIRGGDIDKLQRAVFDAITGVVYTDDGRLCSVLVHRVYATAATPPGVLARIYQLTNDDIPEET
jgi:crossover junction endodeoxyribonuclease RusA